ncbi:LysR family transcriptional regulator [Microbispora rosea]|uniref:LysR family transcriptional regulator n=1 Tax=Microbispora rosea TaxID=58117 RepID=UPI003D8B1949
MREIEAFLAVAEELHFGRAAQRLHLSTSRVSHLIRALERRAGAPLFARTSRRVHLTTAGEGLLAEVRPAYEQLSTALRQARESPRRCTRSLIVEITPLGAEAHDEAEQRYRMRDVNDPHRPELYFSHAQWDTFVHSASARQ